MLANFISAIRELLSHEARPAEWPAGDTMTGMQRLMQELNEPLGREFMIAGLAQVPRYAERRSYRARA